MPFLADTRGLTYSFIGLLVGLHSVGNLFSSFTAGILPRYLGRRPSILVFNACYALAFVLILVTRANWWLVVAFLLTGVARGATSNFCNIVVNDLAPGKAWIFSGLHGMFAVGAFLLPLIVMGVARSNWIIAVYLLIGAGLLSFLLYATMPLDPALPAARRMTTIRGRPRSAAAPPQSIGETSRRLRRAVDPSRNPREGKWGFLRDKLFWLVSLSLMAYLAAEQGVIGWLVTFFRDTGLLSIYLAQVMASVLWVAILFGRLATAYLSTRVPRHRLLVIMGIGLIVFFATMMATSNPTIIVIGIIGFGLSMAGIYPTVVSYAGGLIQHYALAWSFILTGAALGAVLMPNIIGFVAERVGLFYGMASIAGALILTNVLLFALIRHVRT